MYDYWFDAANNTLVVKWQNLNVVSVASNHLSLDPLRPVEQTVKGQMGKTAVQQPHLLRQYNWYMGGVELHDWLVSRYAVSIRRKKWYWALFMRLLDMAVVNTWTLFNMVVDKEKEMTLVDFRR